MTRVWWLFLILLLSGRMFSADSIPDAPQPQSLLLQSPQRSADIAHQKSSPKVLDKKFVLLHTLFLGSVVYDSEVTHQGLAHHKCVEAYGKPYPSRGDLYAKNLGYAAAFTALDYLLKRMNVRFAPFVPATIGTIKHIRGGTSWFTQGWY